MTEDYMDRFGGVGRLYGMPALQRFSEAHVMIVGVGGVGSWTAEALARAGVGELSLVDMDDLCITNTNRQLPAHNGNYGNLKADAIAQRIKLINPDCVVNIIASFYSERNASKILSSNPDIVIDAIDAVKAKAHLLAQCVSQGVSVISCGGAGGRMDASKIKVADLSRTHGDKLSSSVRQRLRKEYGYPSGEGKKPKPFKIPTVFSDEEMTPPQPCASEDAENQMTTQTPRNLNCATGYGAITHVTAAFGLMMAQVALESLKNGD